MKEFKSFEEWEMQVPDSITKDALWEFGKDYARFLRIALGSVRESRGWYYRARHVLAKEIVKHRINLTEELIAGLVAMAKMQSRK